MLSKVKDKIKKLYPYKRTNAHIEKIEKISEESGFYTDYTFDDAEYDLRRKDPYRKYDDFDIYVQVTKHAKDKFGYVETDWAGRPVSKVYETWYEYHMVLKFEDLSNKTYTVLVKKETTEKYAVGSDITVYYNMNDPKIVKFDSTNSIDDLYCNVCIGVTCISLLTAMFFWGRYNNAQ